VHAWIVQLAHHELIPHSLCPETQTVVQQNIAVQLSPFESRQRFCIACSIFFYRVQHEKKRQIIKLYTEAKILAVCPSTQEMISLSDKTAATL